MSMPKPISYQIMPFDAKQEQDIQYVYQGDQQFSNKLVVYKSSTTQIVYEQMQVTFHLKHTIPANALINGETYEYEIIIYDRNNISSPPSDRKLLICLDTPTFTISNLIQEQVVRNSHFNISLNYSQLQGELLNSYQVVLYDFGGKELHKSNLLYATGNLDYLLTSLLDNTSYSVQATGQTVNGMDIITSKIYFTTDYLSPASFAKVSLENIHKEASVKIESNIIAIDGKSNPSPPIFINNEKVDLTLDNSCVLYDEGFSINADFAIKIDCNQISPNVTFFELSDGRNKIVLQKWGGVFDEVYQNYFVLYIVNKFYRTRVVSELTSIIPDEEEITLTIRKIKNLYSVVCDRKEVLT